MNTAKTYTGFCTLHLFAKPSFSLVSKCSSSSNLHRLSSLSLKTKHYLQLRSRLNHVVSSASHCGHLMVQDDLHAFLQILPLDLREVLQDDPKRDQLLEVILDLGRLPEARYLDEYGGKYLRIAEVVVDTSNGIGGDGNIPHAAIGNARRMQVPDPSLQHRVMIEAVENHMPEVIVVDEIGTEAEVLACRSIAERGIMLIGTAHGERLKNIIKNPTLSDLIGGLETITLGDEEARARRSQKSVLERKGPPTFDFLIEMRERHHWVAHRTEKSVDMLLRGKSPLVEVRKRNNQFGVVIERWKTYDESDI